MFNLNNYQFSESVFSQDKLLFCFKSESESSMNMLIVFFFVIMENWEITEIIVRTEAKKRDLTATGFWTPERAFFDIAI